MSLKLGQTVSGLLNASFGNAVEIIVGVAALLQGVSISVLYVVILALKSNSAR
jgi:Ca2+:H+ antiporter